MTALWRAIVSAWLMVLSPGPDRATSLPSGPRIPAVNLSSARRAPTLRTPPRQQLQSRNLVPTPGAVAAHSSTRRGGGWDQYDPTSVYDQRGVSAPRGFSVQAPNELIDPFSGNLVITHTDLFLPGAGGLDLVLQRVYNSKIHRNYAARATGDPTRITIGMLFVPASPVGLGWSLHLGRLVGAVSSAPNNTLAGPRYYERSDGSQHPFFSYTGAGCGDETTDVCLLTRQKDNPYRASVDDPWILNTTNGRNLTFDHTAFDGSSVVHYVTEIRDVFGNNIQISYHDDTIPGIPFQRDDFRHFIDSITDSFGRQISFNYAEVMPGVARLVSITALRRTYTYVYSSEEPWPGLRAFLVEARPPEGGVWKYDYDGIVSGDCADNGKRWCELTDIEYPTGGTIEYTFDDEIFWAQTNPMAVRAVSQRVTGGRAVTPGTWSYVYNRGASYVGDEHTVITRPDGSKEVFTYFGVGNATYNPLGFAWKAGALLGKDVRAADDSVLQSETYEWVGAPAFSNEIWGDPWIGFDVGVSVPRMQRHVIQRGGRTWTTEHTSFHDSNDRPRCTTETGDAGARYRLDAYVNESQFQGTRLYRFLNLQELELMSYNPFSAAACDPSQSVGVPLTFADEIRQRFHDNNGHVVNQMVNGVWTDFDYHADGSLRAEIVFRGAEPSGAPTDGVCTTFENYLLGTARIIGHGASAPACTDPVFSISRSVNTDGSVGTEANGRGFATSFDYDDLGRTIAITPPPQSGENAVTITYDGSPASPSTFKRIEHGAYSLETRLDGFGRETEKVTSAGVHVRQAFDAMGRILFQSLPSYDPNSPAGDTTTYDGLGRIRTVTHADGTGLTYAYDDGAHTVTITDELTRTTVRRRQAFAHPDEFRLVSVQLPSEPIPPADMYTYLVGGHLGGVHYAGRQRVIQYNLAKQVLHEFSPETGNIFYGYDAAGNLRCRDRGEDNTRCNDLNPNDEDAEVRYALDRLGRVTDIHYANPGMTDVSFTYDNADNVDTMNDAVGSHTFTYTATNRLERRESLVRGVNYTTSYEYDSRGNMRELIYPSGRILTYEYDAGNRVTTVREGGRNIASGIAYHANGLVSTLTYGNDIASTQTLEVRQRSDRLTASGVIGLNYGYDDVGNVTSLTDSVTGFSGTFMYDSLDRLEDATGPWGALHYDYNAAGDRTQEILNGQGTVYQYDVFGQLESLRGRLDFDFAYDNFGNAVRRAVAGDRPYAYVYDLENRMVEVNRPDAFGNTTPVVDYAHDGQGQLTLVTRPGCRNTVVYHYDQKGKRIAESRETGAMLREYVVANSRTIAEIDLRTDTPGDFDGDTEVGASDLPFMNVCLSGPGRRLRADAPGCVRADLDGDSDADLHDVALFQLAFTCSEGAPVAGGCCLEDGSCHVDTDDGCAAGGGVYQGGGTDCAAVVCPTSRGACCLADSSCFDGTDDACLSVHGTHQGGGSTCASVTCPLLLGACCQANGTCIESTDDDCIVAGGNFEGVATTCDAVSCQPPGYRNDVDLASFSFFNPGGSGADAVGDDLELAGNGGCRLIRYEIAVWGDGGGPFDVTASLYDACPDDGGVLIAGTTSTWTNVADGSIQMLASDAAFVPIPQNVWLAVTFSTNAAGWVVAGEAEEGITQDLFGLGDSDSWTCNTSFGGTPHSGFWAVLACE